MSKRRKVQRETPEYAAMMRRLIRAHGRRVAEADLEDLADLARLQEDLDAALQAAVDGIKERHSWAEVGRALGVSKQAAFARFLRSDAGMSGSESA